MLNVTLHFVPFLFPAADLTENTQKMLRNVLRSLAGLYGNHLLRGLLSVVQKRCLK
jgi:hypothetical protein